MSIDASGAAVSTGATRRRGQNAGYDFNRHDDKVEVAHRVLARLQREIEIAGARSRIHRPSQVLAHQVAIARLLWPLLSNDRSLWDRLDSLRCSVDDALLGLFKELIERGDMHPLEHRSALNLSRTCWLVWLSWLRAEHIANSYAPEPSIQALSRGLSLIVTVWEPYFEVDLRILMKIELANILTR